MSISMPPEWAPQAWLWIGFPHDAEEWPGYLDRAQEQIAAFANAVAESGQEARLLVRDAANEARAKALVSGAVALERRVFGDVGLPVVVSDWILEGGAIDGDGTGLVVTTEQCLLNPNRNPKLSRAEIEARLHRDLGFDRVLWLGDGLINDHTDGHVDNLARFVGPNRLALPRATGKDDPYAAIDADARARAEAFGVEVCEIPSPGLITRGDFVEPASYANFAITTNLVVVPTFGSIHDDEGVAAIAALVPDHATIGLPADAVLAGGGGFHCASQQMPAGVRPD